MHWHLIPKPSSKQGLQFAWLQERVPKEHLALQAQRFNERLTQ